MVRTLVHQFLSKPKYSRSPHHLQTYTGTDIKVFLCCGNIRYFCPRTVCPVDCSSSNWFIHGVFISNVQPGRLILGWLIQRTDHLMDSLSTDFLFQTILSGRLVLGSFIQWTVHLVDSSFTDFSIQQVHLRTFYSRQLILGRFIHWPRKHTYLHSKYYNTSLQK